MAFMVKVVCSVYKILGLRLIGRTGAVDGSPVEVLMMLRQVLQTRSAVLSSKGESSRSMASPSSKVLKTAA